MQALGSSPEDNYPKLFFVQKCYTAQINTPTSSHSSAGKAPHCQVLLDSGPTKSPILSRMLWRLLLHFSLCVCAWTRVCKCPFVYCCSVLPIKQTHTCSCAPTESREVREPSHYTSILLNFAFSSIWHSTKKKKNHIQTSILCSGAITSVASIWMGKSLFFELLWYMCRARITRLD